METNSLKAFKLLLFKMEEAKQRNPRYSQRAFAKKIGISPGALSEVVAGKRSLTMDIKKRIADRLDFSPQERRDFFWEDLPSHLRAERTKYHLLTNDQFYLISDWWHYGILNLLNTKGFKPTPSWIAKRLDLPKVVIEDAWSRLIRLGLLEKTPAGYKRKHARLETSEDLFDISIQRAHLEDLRLIEKSLVSKPVHERDSSSMTFVMNKKDLKLAKELIRKFQDQFVAELEPKSGDEIFKLSMHLFPLTHPVENS